MIILISRKKLGGCNNVRHTVTSFDQVKYIKICSYVIGKSYIKGDLDSKSLSVANYICTAIRFSAQFLVACTNDPLGYIT